MTYCIINTTTSSKQEAKDIAKVLIENKLIACCTIIENAESLYCWDAKLNDEKEVLMIMKTKTELFGKVEEQIKKLHSYEVPEIICTPVIAGNKEYLNWIEEQTINI